MATEPDLDVQLMLRLQAGDRSALAALLARNASRVLALALRYTGDRSHADDVVQETFLKLYAARERYRPDAPFHSYLLRIASNVCLSALRKKRPLSLDSSGADSSGDDDGPPEPAETSPRPAPIEGMVQDEMARRVRDAVARLPDRQRLAIILNKFEGLDYQQVADQLGLTVPATKSLLHRARMVLKEALEPHMDGETRGSEARSTGGADDR